MSDFSHVLDVGVDIDGVLYPFERDVKRAAARFLGVQEASLAPATRWNFFEEWGIDLATFHLIQARAFDASGLFDVLPPDGDGLLTLRQLKAEGHRIHYVTARAVDGVEPAAIAERTAWWIERHGLPCDSLSFSVDKASVRTDVFIDDAPHNVEALLAAGHPEPRLLHRPWNWDAEHLPRALSWAHFGRIVRAASLRRSAA